jgi:hypothetical protein
MLWDDSKELSMQIEKSKNGEMFLLQKAYGREDDPACVSR